MIAPVMAISNLVLTRQIYSEETNGAHAHYREPVPLKEGFLRYDFEGLIFGGAYTWRGFYMEGLIFGILR